MLSPLRKERVTGSQAGAILGLSPYSTREDVMNDWLYGSTFKGNVATEYGQFYEPFARDGLTMELGFKQELRGNDEFFIHPDHNWLGATPDVVLDDAVAEIKCPYGKREAESSDEFKPLIEQHHYYAQVQLEMACTGKTKCYFYQWAPRGVAKLEVVKFDQEWFDWAIPILKAFVDEYKERKESLTDDQAMAQKYHRLKAAFDEIKEELDQHKDAMIKTANGKKRKFGDVSVYPVERKGSVSYSKVVKDHLPDIDLEPYRGKSSVSWVVK